VNIEWRCNLCKETFETQEVFRGHMIAVHENEITTSQVEEVMSTSKRLVPCTIATQLCPFCLTAPSEAQAGFASHVGKHQQEIALAALPRLGDTPDDEKTEYSESSDNDDDDDDPKAIPSAGDGEEKRAASEHHDQDLAKPQQQTKPVLSRQNSADYSRENVSPSVIRPPWSSNINAKSVEPSVTSPSLSQQDISRESHSVSQDAQQSINTTWGPQNRLMFTIRDFEKTINKCGDLWKLLPPEATSKPAFISLNKEMDQLREISELLASISLSLDQPIIEKSIEAFSICRTQLIRLQRLLDSTIYNVDEPDKKSRRPNVILKQLFTRQQTSQKPDISKAQDVLVGLLEGRQSLSNILNKVQLPQRDREHSESLSGAEAQLSPERLGPQMVLSPTGTLHINKHISSQRSSAERSLAQHATMSDAIRDGHLEYVTRYLDGGLDVNEKLGDHGPALTVAALSGQDAIVKLLLDRGANVNVISGNYGTALHAAASCLHESIITILLGNGADINIQAGEHGTVLQEAVMNARNQDDPTIILLIKRGADVNAVGGRYGTALQAAAVTGQLSTVKLLLTQGADVDAQGGEYGNALQAASAGGNLATVAQLIAAGANVNARGGKHYTALRAARHVEIGPSGKVSELLLNNGADPAISPENDGAAFTFPREASERKATLGPLRTSFLDDYQKYELFLNEETGPERKTGTEVDSTRPGSPSSVPEETSKNPFVHPIVRSDRVSIPEILKSQFSLDAYDPVDGTEVFEEDDVAYPCKGCGDIVSLHPQYL
jgi:ankyrin repeat protein